MCTAPLQVSRLFQQKLQLLDKGRGSACLSMLLDGWPAKQALKLGEITLGQIMPCVTAPEEEQQQQQRSQDPRRWRDNGRPWAAGGKHSKAFKKEKNETKFWAPGGRQSGVHKRRAYAIQFTDGTDRIAAKPKRGRPSHRSSRSR